MFLLQLLVAQQVVLLAHSSRVPDSILSVAFHMLCLNGFPLGFMVSKNMQVSKLTTVKKFPLSVNMHVDEALQWTGINVNSPAMCSVLCTGSGSTTTLKRIKWLLNMN